MKKHTLIFVLALIVQVAIGQDITQKDNIWTITTNNSSYSIIVEDGVSYPLFWGERVGSENIDPKQYRVRQNGPYAVTETPVRGRYADKMPMVEAIFADNTRDIELKVQSIEVQTINGRQTLVVTQVDKHYPLQIKQYIRTLPEYDMLEKWVEVQNTSKNKKEAITIENLLSGSLYLQPDRYYLTQHSGQWCREFALQKSEITTGIKSLQGRDFFNFQNTPWAVITNKPGDDSHNTPTWFMQVHYSGNFRLDFEMAHSAHVQVVGGINFWDTHLTLNAGDKYSTPKMSFGYTPNGTESAAQLTAQYVRNEILPKPIAQKPRPVLYNSWYATTFAVEEKQQIALAEVAKKIGVEMFVVDDGWFKGRVTDHAGLGDWTIDKTKFPNGLGSLIKSINDLGMEFGIWVEPEMVNPNSDLYRAHPDWVLHFPNRERTEWRNQLTLNLGREDVYSYLYNSMRDLLKNNNIKFIKWDRNRGLTQPGWPGVDPKMAREVRLRYMNNLYRMIDELKLEFPDVIFESCSSGGGRPDLGMLERMDQVWASDNTDPVDRLHIQYGYLSSYPANTMVCWTNSSDHHNTGAPLEYFFDVAMQGVLGVGQNISKWDDKTIEIAAKKIAQYKDIRPLVQYGTVSRLLSPMSGSRVAIQYTSQDKANSVVLCYNLSEVTEGATMDRRESQLLKLENLDPTKSYTVSGKVYSGEYLMKIGLPWSVRGVYRSNIVKIDECK